MGEEKRNARHTVIMEKREQISITGVDDVLSFDEEGIICETDMGILVIRGMNLHVNKLSLENGELFIDGEIDSLEYSDTAGGMKGKGSLWGKIFK